MINAAAYTAVDRAEEEPDTEDDDHKLTMLVMQESLCTSVWAYAVESKGAGEGGGPAPGSAEGAAASPLGLRSPLGPRARPTTSRCRFRVPGSPRANSKISKAPIRGRKIVSDNKGRPVTVTLPFG